MFRFIPMVFSLLLLAACHTPPTYLNVYDGLLPVGYQVKDSPESIRAETLKSKTVALVTSTNFNNYTNEWQAYYEKGGQSKTSDILRSAGTALGLVGGPMTNIGEGISKGADASSGAGGDPVRQSSDPRNVVNRVYSAIKPYFKEVKAAADFAEAQEMKADYVVLIDYYGAWNKMGDMYTTKGGAYVLDRSLRRVFQAEGSAEVEREDGGFLSGPSGVIAGTARTYTKALDGTTNQILAGLRSKLGVAPR